MANTTSILSYANTFGDWVVQSNALSKENNDLAANNYIKPTGTLYLNGLPLGLQVANNVVVGGQLQVQGIGSSAIIQNNLTVTTGQVYFSNTILGLTNAGQANIGGPLLALSAGTGLTVSNNAIVQGNTAIGGNVTITGNTSIANNLVVTKNASANNLNVVNNSNTNTLIVLNNAYVNNDLKIINKTTTYTLQANGTTSLLGDVVVGDPIGTVASLTVTGDFVVNGNSLVDTDRLTLKAVSPQTIGAGYDFIVVNRGEDSNPYNANSQIRWNESDRYWDLRDVGTPTNYYRILTNQHLSDSITTANSTIVATSQAAKTLNDSIISNVASLQSQISSNVISINSSLSSNSSILNTFANNAYNRANTSSNTFIGTSGSATPANGIITLNSTWGVSAVGSGNTITINTPQDIRANASPSFQAISLISSLPLIYGGTGATSSSGALANLLPGGAYNGYVLTTGGAGSYSWSPQAGTSGVPPGTTISSSRLSYTATASQTLFTSPTYIIGSGQLRIYQNGVRQYLSDYVETSTTSVTLNVGCALNDTVLIEVDGYIINPYYANNITYTAPQGGIVASSNTIQLAINDLESRKATLASPQLTGTPLAITAAVGTNSTQIATTGFVYNVLGTTSATYACSISGNSGSTSAVTWANVSGKPDLITQGQDSRTLYNLYTNVIRDSDNNGYYLDMNGTSRLSTVNADYLHSYGAILADGNVTAYSDARLKTNILKIDNALDKVGQLNGYTFDRIDKDMPRQTGILAQELLKVLPEAVMGSEDTTYAVAYGNIVGLLIEAIKELKLEIDELKGNK